MTGTETNFTTDWETKVFGVKWNTLSDTFSFSVNRQVDVTFTKRGLFLMTTQQEYKSTQNKSGTTERD